MEMHERIQQLRKELRMSRRVFGEKLGVSSDVINNIESNRLKRPDQKEPLYMLICEKFNVNYQWLSNGSGEMFKDGSHDAPTIIRGLGLESDESARTLFKLSQLNEKQRQTIDNLIDLLLEKD